MTKAIPWPSPEALKSRLTAAIIDRILAERDRESAIARFDLLTTGMSSVDIQQACQRADRITGAF